MSEGPLLNSRAHDALQAYFRKNPHLTVNGFARTAGVLPMQITHILKNRRRASFETAFAIEDATGGAVQARWWLEEEEE